MKITTLCYIINKDEVLFLLRNKKTNDLNANKYIGVGGKVENGESCEEGIIREIYEETGLTATKVKLQGIITFILPKWEDELCFVYTCEDYQGKIQPCDEGELVWVKKQDIDQLTLWEGDRIFLPYLFDDNKFFVIKLVYDQNDNLVSWKEENCR
ncbi:MAG: 8-oxo-dGTP diphosphatase [Erysipelotrichaceae bacterium]|nr:8-oxo-dGTP diphosphatase [Erysipelotrichaceae bacterium]MDY5251181.1 8-oxo-dGTP diphosphatase [Erysipelotrichaceae bacterium]